MVAAGQLVAGRYRLEQPLAAGGMGGVWLAHDEADDQPVAIKKCHLPDGLTHDEQDLFRVWTIREARSFAVVGHPNVVRTLDVLPDDEAPWIVMEYVPSRSLQQVIDQRGPLPPARVAGIGLAVLEALRAVRRSGLLHLDVKPGNVLIADDGRVVLTDFGPAVTTEGVRALAGAGIVLGSPKYLAPERFMDGLALPESDLWSLGATLYHAVEGRPPFARATTAETLLALTEGPPDPIELAGPLAPVIDGLLRREPHARLTPPEIEAALRAVLEQPAPEPIEPAPLPLTARPPARAGHRRTAVLAGLAVLLVALVAVFVVVRPRDEPAAQPAARPAAWSLPAGFYWWDDRSGYRIGLPDGWGPAPGGAGELTARADSGLPMLRVTAVTPVPADVVTYLIAGENRIGLAAYRRIRITPLPDSDDAVWEYTYQDPKLGPLRVLERVMVDPGRRMFLLIFTAPRDRWAANLFAIDTVVDSFTTASGG